MPCRRRAASSISAALRPQVHAPTACSVIPVPNGPARPLQMVHVTDLAAALVRAVTAPQAAGVYHIAEARAYTWEEVGRLVGEAVGRRVRVVRVPAALISG